MAEDASSLWQWMQVCSRNARGAETSADECGTPCAKAAPAAMHNDMIGVHEAIARLDIVPPGPMATDGPDSSGQSEIFVLFISPRERGQGASRCAPDRRLAVS